MTLDEKELTKHARKEEALNSISHALVQADIYIGLELINQDDEVKICSSIAGIYEAIAVPDDIEGMIFTVMAELIKIKLSK